MSNSSTINLILPQWDGGSRKIRFIYLVNPTAFRLTNCPDKVSFMDSPRDMYMLLFPSLRHQASIYIFGLSPNTLSGIIGKNSQLTFTLIILDIIDGIRVSVSCILHTLGAFD